MAEASAVTVSVRGPVATLTLARPERHNAFDDALIATLTERVTALADRADIRALVLTGQGRSFCAGADLDWMRRMAGANRAENVADAERLAALFRALDACPKPLIGRIHGAAIGGGVGLVSVCDIALASERAVFALAEVRLGLLPAVIAPYVMRKIGESGARALFLTGERFDAARALRLGLVHGVLAPDALDAAVAEAVDGVLASGPNAVRECKALIRDLRAAASPDEVTAHTVAAIADIRSTAEARAGMAAFLAKTPPPWRTPEPESEPRS